MHASRTAPSPPLELVTKLDAFLASILPLCGTIP